MSGEIQASIVAGVLGGLTVVAGVVLAERLARSRDRRRVAMQRALRLSVSLPHVVVPASERWDGRRPPLDEWVPLWMAAQEELMALRYECWGFAGARRVRSEADRLRAGFVVLMDAYVDDGRIVTTAEVRLLNKHDLARSLLPRRLRGEYLDDAIEPFRRDHGLTPRQSDAA